MSDNKDEKMNERLIEPYEWQQPFLQLPLSPPFPPEEYIRQMQEEEEEKPPTVIIIDI